MAIVMGSHQQDLQSTMDEKLVLAGCPALCHRDRSHIHDGAKQTHRLSQLTVALQPLKRIAKTAEKLFFAGILVVSLQKLTQWRQLLYNIIHRKENMCAMYRYSSHLLL